MLNLGAWLLFELCDGRSLEDLRAAYMAAAGGGRDDEAVREEMHVAIEQLLSDGLIEQVVA